MSSKRQKLEAELDKQLHKTKEQAAKSDAQVKNVLSKFRGDPVGQTENNLASQTMDTLASQIPVSLPLASQLAKETTALASQLAKENNLASQENKEKENLASQKYEARRDPNKQPLNVRLNRETIRKIKVLCAESGLDIQDFMEMAASQMLETLASQTQQNLASKLALDDLTIYKTLDDIIKLYQKYTNNKWKHADDRLAVEFNTLDRRRIELGLLQTLLNFKGQRINSFKYFLPEIKEWQHVHMSDDGLETVLEIMRRKWEAKKQST